MIFNRVTLQHNNKFIIIIIIIIIIIFCYLMVSVITMCNPIKRLIRATFLSTPEAMFKNDENKRHQQAIKRQSP